MFIHSYIKTREWRKIVIQYRCTLKIGYIKCDSFTAAALLAIFRTPCIHYDDYVNIATHSLIMSCCDSWFTIQRELKDREKNEFMKESWMKEEKINHIHSIFICFLYSFTSFGYWTVALLGYHPEGLVERIDPSIYFF